MVVTATPNQASSGQLRGCSTVAIKNDRIDLMQFPSDLSAPTLLGHYYTRNAILQPPHTTRRCDVVLAATPYHASSGHLRGCRTSTIENDRIAFMLRPSLLFARASRGNRCC